MTLRDERQLEFARVFLDEQKSGILYLCPRFGKCRVALNILQEMKSPRVLIAYPDLKIKKSWQDEFEKMEMEADVVYSTHRSLSKWTEELFHLVIIDEVHALSEAQIDQVKKLRKDNRILGLTGTMSKHTENTLRWTLNLPVLATYSISQAIEEGVIVDYEIRVKKVALDGNVLQSYKTGKKTEKKQFDAYSYIIQKLENERKDTKFLRMSRMRLIQQSWGKLKATKDLLSKYTSERVLVFCGQINALESLGIPVFHSKSTRPDAFEKFAEGLGKHLGVVKIGAAGITYKPLDKVIINYFDSNPENLAQKINRCMAMEYDNPEKKAIIYIITSNEEVELKWLDKALAFFDPFKIKYV